MVLNMQQQSMAGPFLLGWVLKLWDIKLQIHILQIVSSVILTLYTQLAFDNIGYAWTFIIMGFIATAGTSVSCLESTYIFLVNILGVVLTYFFPQNISSEDFRERFGNGKEEIA